MQTTRSADVYVFAFHDDDNMETADLLDIERWLFWVMTAAEIEEAFGRQKTVALGRIRNHGHEATAGDLYE